MMVLILLLCFLGTSFTQSEPAYGDLRLVDGLNGSRYEGRIEVFINGSWGTVCDDSWNILNSIVACRQLNLRASAPVTLIGPSIPDGVGQIFLDDVRCAGTEMRLIDCLSNPIGIHNCAHAEDIGIRCLNRSITFTPPNGNIRLSGGRSETEGRVEIFVNGTWGTVCDDFWDAVDASVVCRQLGFNQSYAVAVGSLSFGAGTGPIYLDDVVCTGAEARLVDCLRNPLGHNCGHYEDAGVMCLQQSSTRENGTVRLVGGRDMYEGRVEINVNGVWGTVCDDGWDHNDAAVVCRQLNYSTTGARAVGSAQFGRGTGIIWLDDVGCVGNEFKLINCTAHPFGIHNCVHIEDAGVICHSNSSNVCVGGDLRLVNGSVLQEGRVEVCLNGLWGTICDDSWGSFEARVVCRQLMLPFSDAMPFGNAYFGEGSGLVINLDDVTCIGNEERIVDCAHSGPGIHNCGHAEDAGVRCMAATLPPLGIAFGDIRLVGGTTVLEGRVEVFSSSGVWGTVCDDRWNSNDAEVVCRQLGFPTDGAEALLHSAFGPGTATQPIILDDVACTGSETMLIRCSHLGIGIHNCVHLEDASVRCPKPPAPGAPINVHITPSASSCSEVAVDWDLPPGYPFPNVITGFRVRVTALTDGGSTLTLISRSTSLVVRQLICNTNYYVVVTALAFGEGTPSNVTLFATKAESSRSHMGGPPPLEVRIVIPILVIGLLVSAILAVVIFIIYKKKKRVSPPHIGSDDNSAHVTANVHAELTPDPAGMKAREAAEESVKTYSDSSFLVPPDNIKM